MELALLDFIERLAIDALRRGGSGFQAPQADFDAARIAVAVVFFIDAFDRLVDLFDQSAFTIARAQFDTELFFLSRPIGRIGEVRRFVLHVMNRAVHFFHQFLAPFQEDVAEMVELLRIHVGFAALRLVWNEILER